MRYRLGFLALVAYLSLAVVGGWYGWIMLARPRRYAAQAYDNPLIQQTIEEAVESGAIAIVQPGGQVGYDRNRIPPWCRGAVDRYIRKGYIRARDGQVVVEDNLSRRANPHSATRAKSVFLRGAILDRNGTPLAWSSVVDFRPRRHWLDSEACFHLLGRPDARFAAFGLEKACNEALSSLRSPVLDRVRQFQLEPVEGRSVTSTLDADAQRAAYRALKDRTGAAVVIDTLTDGVLVAVSSPSIPLDAGEREWFAAHDQGASGVMLNRAFDGLYPPGSTFKTIVAAAALETGKIVNGQAAPCAGSYRPLADAAFAIQDHERRETPGWGGHNPGGGPRFTVGDAYAHSCNVTFARIGVALGNAALTEWAGRFGFGAPVEIALGEGMRPLRGAAPVVWAAPGESSLARQTRPRITNTHIAQAAIGQYEVRASPLEMAIVAATVANGGELCRPRLVQPTPQDGGTALYRQTAAPAKPARERIITRATAEILQDWMRRVIEDGTGQPLRQAGVSLAGKTGTAQVGDGKAHGWFIGFAPAETPRIAFAVIVEHGGYGSTSAAPIAAEIVRACLLNEAARPASETAAIRAANR